MFRIEAMFVPCTVMTAPPPLCPSKGCTHSTSGTSYPTATVAGMKAGGDGRTSGCFQNEKSTGRLNDAHAREDARRASRDGARGSSEDAPVGTKKHIIIITMSASFPRHDPPRRWPPPHRIVPAPARARVSPPIGLAIAPDKTAVVIDRWVLSGAIRRGVERACLELLETLHPTRARGLRLELPRASTLPRGEENQQTADSLSLACACDDGTDSLLNTRATLRSSGSLRTANTTREPSASARRVGVRAASSRYDGGAEASRALEVRAKVRGLLPVDRRRVFQKSFLRFKK